MAKKQKQSNLRNATISCRPATRERIGRVHRDTMPAISQAAFLDLLVTLYETASQQAIDVAWRAMNKATK